MNPGELIHLYIDGAFDRRELVKRLAKVVGGTRAALGLIAAEGLMAQEECQTCPDDVRVPADADDLNTQSVQYDGQASQLFGYLATKKTDSTDPIPGVIVIHENRGLTDYVKDVTRRLARAGYAALGIDLLSRLGGTDQYTDPTAAVSAYNSLSAEARLQDMLSSLRYLQSLPITAGKKMGCIGFCAGGGNSFQLAVNGGKDISAAVVFYGTPPTQPQIADQLTAPVLCCFGEQDRNFTGMLPAFITNALNARKTFGTHIYQGANHAFHNDTGAAYNRDAACDAWAKTLAWYGKYLA